MKLIDPTKSPAKGDGLQKALNQLGKLIPLGSPQNQAEEMILARFYNLLDNRYTLLRNLRFEVKGEVFPPILVGPAGLFILNLSHARGIFKAKDDAWLELDETTKKYIPARPNLIRQSRDYGLKLAGILDDHGKRYPEISTVLILTEPGVSLETSNPVIRIVRMDGVDKLLQGWTSQAGVLQASQYTSLIDSLEIIANPEKAIPKGEEVDFFGRDLKIEKKKVPLKLPDIPIPTEIPTLPLEKKLKLNKKQWTFLGVLVLLTIVFLVVAILYILAYIRP